MTMYDPETIAASVPEVLEKYQIKAIETMHSGIRFRSRIEARWAVFFETLRLPYEYEKEGFDLGDGKLYLPDFWLPTLNVWFEVKGADPDEDSCDKANRLAVGSRHRVFVFYAGHTLPTSQFGPPKGYAFFVDGTADFGYCWCQCPKCGQFGIEYEGRADRLPCKESHVPGERAGCQRVGDNRDKGVNIAPPVLMQAYTAARSARFGR